MWSKVAFRMHEGRHNKNDMGTNEQQTFVMIHALPLAPTWIQIRSCSSQLDPIRPQVGPKSSQVDPKLGQIGASWPQVGPRRPKLAQVGAKLVPSWSQVGPKLAQVGPKLAPSWPQVGPSWPKLVPRGFKSSKSKVLDPSGAPKLEAKMEEKWEKNPFKI